VPSPNTALSDLADYGRRRDALLNRIVDLLSADRRVGAAWLSGSFGRGEADEWSDLDLHVAVEDTSLREFLAERSTLYRRIARPILVQQEMASPTVPDGVFQSVIFPGPKDAEDNDLSPLLPVVDEVLLD
jgi:predicted nucleotidyltransferase